MNIVKQIRKDKKLLIEINKMAIPIILSSMSSVLLTLADQAIVGRISIYAYAGVGLVTNIINSLVGVLGILAVCFNILGSKSKAKDDINDINEKLSVGIVVSLIIGGISFLTIYVFSETILNDIFGLSGEILIEASKYIKIFSMTIGLNLIIFLYSSVFKIFKNTKNIFLVCTLVNIVNVILDYILVFGKFGFPELGSIGSAIGTVISLIFNIFSYHYLAKNNIKLKFKIPDFKKHFKALIKLAIPIMGQEFFEDMFFVFGINIIIARIGVIELSIYSLMLNIFNLLLMPMFAYASTSMTLVSEYSTKENLKKCQKANGICILTTIFIYIICSIIILILRDKIPRLITTDINLINGFLKYILIVIIINTFNIVQTIYKYSLQALNCEKWIFKFSFSINIITLMLMFIFSKKFGLNAIYYLFGLNFLYLSILFILKYNKTLIKEYINYK